jgi:hypothetical protein
MGLFDGANEAAMMGSKLPRLGDFHGRHVVKIDSIRAKLGEGKFKGQALFVVEGEIVKSNNPTCAPGTKAGWVVVKDTKWPEYFFSDIKRLIGALTRKDAATIGAAHMEAISADPQPAKGRSVGAYCFPNVTKTKGVIGQVEWSPADATTDVGPMLPASVASPGPAPAVAATPAAAGGGFAPTTTAAPVVDFGF